MVHPYGNSDKVLVGNINPHQLPVCNSRECEMELFYWADVADGLKAEGNSIRIEKVWLVIYSGLYMIRKCNKWHRRYYRNYP